MDESSDEPLDDEHGTDLLPSDFWGPVSNFGIPIAAVMDSFKSPEMCVHRPPPPLMAFHPPS